MTPLSGWRAVWGALSASLLLATSSPGAAPRAIPAPPAGQDGRQYDDRSETWSCPLGCGAADAARRLRRAATVFGEDDRSVIGAFLDDDERRFYSGVGLVRCLTKAGTISISTAFHVGSFSTLVSTAHGFYSPGKRQRVNPRACSVIFYDSAGQATELVRVSRIQSRWDVRGQWGDDTQDLAIIKLKKDSRGPLHHYLYRVDAPLTGPIKVVMVGFHYEVDNPTVLRKVQGAAYPPPAHFAHAYTAWRRGAPFAEPKFLAVADYDTSRGSSGAPVFDEHGRVIGINKGSAGGYSSVFNPYDNYTLVVMFDAQFEKDLKAMVNRR